MVRRLRIAERSRRKLLLFAILEATAKVPERFGPLPAVEAVWDLLARVERASPITFDRVLAHPYTGSWAGYVIRLLRNGHDGVGPLWIHLGHVHAVAAAAAIRARLTFQARIPLWHGNAALPTLGLARLPESSSFAVAEVGGAPGDYAVSHGRQRVRLPDWPDEDGHGWWSIRRVHVTAGEHRFSVRLDDVDPYRGLYEPVPPERLATAEVDEWRRMLGDAWHLLVTGLPDYAGQLAVGLDSLVPRPHVLFRNPSASTGEAFGSAVVGRPTDPASLAATLVHEFQHILLGGVLHMTPLYEQDPRERIYVPWRDDPRPLAGAVQGVYAFLGVTRFWRALARDGAGPLARRAGFEFAYWRRQTWGTLRVLHDDTHLTDAGRRFVHGMAEVLEPWQHEPVADDVAALAAAAAADHRAGWRMRHLRPDADVVAGLAQAWRAGRPRPPISLVRTDLSATPIPDGPWSHARADLVRLSLTETGRAELPRIWPAVPGATAADLAFAMGDHRNAAQAYRTELAATPDRPASLVGLGLALAATGSSPAARALLHCPELVRAVHRELRGDGPHAPSPEDLGHWIGQLVTG
jgi:HEXXH motif-containing protein